MTLARYQRLGPVTLLAAALVLSACGGIGERLGMSRTTPDESRIQTNEPLSMPPEFELRPPRDGGGDALARRSDTEQAVFRIGDGDAAGDDLPAELGTNDELTPGERALLTRMGVQDTINELRRIIEADARAQDSGDEGFLDTLMFWRSEPARRSAPSDVVLDAEREAERLGD